jgi:hypothetical protein
MSGFAYFLPNETAAALTAPKNWLAARDRHGLTEALFDVRDPKQFVAADVLRNGPDGGAGTIVVARRNDGEEPKRLGYFADEQTWTKTFGSAWLGYSELPKPEWLRRNGRVSDGALWTPDAIDRKWLIPIARRPGREPQIGPNLPTQTEFDEQRRPVHSVRADAAELWELAGRIWDSFNGEAEEPMTDDELSLAALTALGWYYRIGPAEVSAYARAGEPIIDSESMQRYALSLVHWDVFAGKRAGLGKDDPPTGSDSSTGSTEETPTGDLAGVN